MSKKKFLCLFLAVMMVFALCLTGCGGNNEGEDEGTDAANGDVVTIKFAGTVSEDHPITKGEYKFKEILEEISGGQMAVEVYPNCQLGSNRELYESMQNGTIQMAEAGAVILANFTDKFKFMQIPYLFNSAESVQCFLNGETGQQMIDDIAAETGFRILCCYENGWQAVTNSKHEIKTADDMKGLKIRTQENDILLKIYEEMGCSPMPMAFTELFTGMQQGTVDGQVNPILIAYTGKYDEVQKYCTDVNAVYDVASVSINEEFYNSLTDEQRGWVDQAIKESCEWQLQASVDATKEAEEQINLEIHKLTDDERQTFIDATAGVVDWFKENINEPNLDLYMEKIAEINQMYTDGKLEAVTGNIL